MKDIKTDIQIRFADVDGLGHINNVHIQEYYDVAKMDFFARVVGSEVVPEHQSPVVVSNHTDYFAQSRLYDKLYVKTAVGEIGTKSLKLFQQLIGHDDGVVRSECLTTLVMFDFAKQESVEVDDTWRKALNEYSIR